MANLTVSLRENLELNGTQYGSRRGFTITGVNEAFKRIVTVTTSETVISSFGAARGNGTFIESDVRYIRISNLDATNHVFLVFKNEDNDEFAVKLDRGQSYIYNADLDGGIVDTMDAAATALTVAHDMTGADLVEITAVANTASCDLEVLVACL